MYNASIRMGQGLSLEELSGRCGIDAAPLSKLERGESNAHRPDP